MASTAPPIDHAPRCQRRRAPLLRLSWRRTLEVICPDCRRTAPAEDQRPTDTKEPTC